MTDLEIEIVRYHDKLNLKDFNYGIKEINTFLKLAD